MDTLGNQAIDKGVSTLPFLSAQAGQKDKNARRRHVFFLTHLARQVKLDLTKLRSGKEMQSKMKQERLFILGSRQEQGMI